jgi:hypothetical protein
LEPLKDKSRLFDARLPLSLDEAALLMYALSFGPLSKAELARALKQVGMIGTGPRSRSRRLRRTSSI